MGDERGEGKLSESLRFLLGKNKAAAEERVRRRSRSRGISPRRSKGKGKQRKGDAGPIGAALPASASSRSTTDDGAIVVRRSQSVKVQLDELQTLEACLGRAIDSQKRTIESLNFFSRMIQDEKHVFTEAKNVIAEVIFKARMARA